MFGTFQCVFLQLWYKINEVRDESEGLVCVNKRRDTTIS